MTISGITLSRQNLVNSMNGRIWEVLSLGMFSELEVLRDSTGGKQY